MSLKLSVRPQVRAYIELNFNVTDKFMVESQSNKSLGCWISIYVNVGQYFSMILSVDHIPALVCLRRQDTIRVLVKALLLSRE